MTAPDAAVGSHRKPLDSEIDVYGLTHPGTVRSVNQDHFLVCSLRKNLEVLHTGLPNTDGLPVQGERMAMLGLVADGVGGGLAGEEASRTAVHSVAQYVASSARCYYAANAQDEREFFDSLQSAALESHAAVVRTSTSDPDRRGMATTLTLLIGVWPRAYILQVGDSRCYLLKGDELIQITRDQTVAQDLIDQGLLTSTAAHRTRWAHVLSSSIGGRQTVPVVTSIDQSWDDVLLLCSDGLTKHVSDDRIRERLRSMTSAQQVCEDLLQDALDGGGTDNITIIVERVTGQE